MKKSILHLRFHSKVKVLSNDDKCNVKAGSIYKRAKSIKSKKLLVTNANKNAETSFNPPYRLIK